MNAPQPPRGEGWEGLQVDALTRESAKLQTLPTLPPTGPRTRGDQSVSDVERRTYTVPEVAKILGIGRNTAYEICRNGEIPTIRIGGRVLVPRSVIDELLEGAR